MRLNMCKKFGIVLPTGMLARIAKIGVWRILMSSSTGSLQFGNVLWMQRRGLGFRVGASVLGGIFWGQRVKIQICFWRFIGGRKMQFGHGHDGIRGLLDGIGYLDNLVDEWHENWRKLLADFPTWVISKPICSFLHVVWRCKELKTYAPAATSNKDTRWQVNRMWVWSSWFLKGSSPHVCDTKSRRGFWFRSCAFM